MKSLDAFKVLPVPNYNPMWDKLHHSAGLQWTATVFIYVYGRILPFEFPFWRKICS